MTRTEIQLNYRQAREAPCQSCSASPCCTYLLLGDFAIGTLMDVDHALYLLNFEGIYLDLNRERAGHIYLYQPCSHLMQPSGLCDVHGTALQPAVCVQYNAHSCWYRHKMTAEVDPDSPLLNHQRMAWLAEHLIFDDDRRVVGFPEWEDVLEGFHTIPLQRTPAGAPPPDPTVEAWHPVELTKKPAGPNGVTAHHFSDPEVSDPCTGCGAWCCKTLVFNRGLPADASQLEHLRYCLGFPGVEVGVAEDSWALIVRTTCRHLVGNRCSVFGTDDRPLQCGYYDALSCKYRSHFGGSQPDDIVRVTSRQFATLADSLVFDELGRIVAIPPIDILRNRFIQTQQTEASASPKPSEPSEQELCPT